MHGLANEFGEASRKRRATEPHSEPEVAQAPRPIELFVDQSKRRTDMRVRHGAEPSAFSGTERFYPASEHFDEEHFGQS
jgi:hypothetical protein